MSVRPFAWLACSLWFLIVALIVLGLAWWVEGGSPPTASNGMMTGPNGLIIGILNGISWLAATTVGAVVAWRRPRHPLGWVVIVMALFIGTRFVADGYLARMTDQIDVSQSSRDLAVWVSTWVFGPAISLTVVLFLLFPNGRLPSRQWLPVLWLVGAFGFLFTAGLTFQPGPLSGSREFVNPAEIESLADVAVFARRVGRTCLMVLLVAAAGSLVVRLFLARGDERQQLKWFVNGALLFALTFIGMGIVPDSRFFVIACTTSTCSLIEPSSIVYLAPAWA